MTGGNSGIGRAFVERLATDGAKVIACGRNEATLGTFRNQTPTIEAVRCDITVRQDVLALAAAIQDRHGRFDVLINNAGLMEHVDLLDERVSVDRIANEIAVNLTGPILLTRRTLPLLRAGRDPLIVMTSSGYALLPATRAPVYSASKAGLHSFTMALRGNSPLWASGSSRFCRHWSIRRRRVLHGVTMSAESLVGRALIDIAKGRDESLPGQVGLLPIMMRLAPSYIARRVAGT